MSCEGNAVVELLSHIQLFIYDPVDCRTSGFLCSTPSSGVCSNSCLLSQ